jgi:hypothetical protein
MVQETFDLRAALVRKVRGALTSAPAPAHNCNLPGGEATGNAASSSRTAVLGDLEPKEPVMVISRRLVQVQHIALLAASLVLLALLIAMPLWG